MNLLDSGPTYLLSLSPTMIRSNLSPPPTYPATFRDLVPTLCASGYTLIFIALLVLLVEDDRKDSKVLGEQQSQLTIHQRRIVGLSEKERNGPCIRNRATMAIRRPEECHGFPASVTVTPWLSHWCF